MKLQISRLDWLYLFLIALGMVVLRAWLTRGAHLLAILLVPWLLGGCLTVGPDYDPPELPRVGDADVELALAFRGAHVLEQGRDAASRNPGGDQPLTGGVEHRRLELRLETVDADQQRLVRLLPTDAIQEYEAFVSMAAEVLDHLEERVRAGGEANLEGAGEAALRSPETPLDA